MRVGHNPLDHKTVSQMPPIIGVVITHLPSREGYHRERFEIIKLCLESMRRNSGRRYLPMAVWDNGSMPEFRAWLLDVYKPDYLTLSPNIGKASARTATVRMFPPETVVCVSDDDMLYYPGWLDAQLKLLRGFPNVGAVSGYPVRTQFRWGTESNEKFAAANGDCKVTRGKLIPEELDREWCTSIGRSYSDQLKMTAKDQDTRWDYKGLSAYATAHHCQFIAEAGRIEFIVQWNDDALSDEKLFDVAIDAAGLLRLTTIERYVRHMGNVMEPEFKPVLNKV